jgi:hypothetical protein
MPVANVVIPVQATLFRRSQEQGGNDGNRDHDSGDRQKFENHDQLL